MMMRSFGYGIMVLILVGCNTQIAVTGAARERLVHPTPFGARWVKEGMTRASRKADWVACEGGSDLRDGFRDWLSPETRESFVLAHESHRYNLWSCMQAKNYKYFNKGYEYEYPKLSGTSEQCDARCLYP